MARERDDLLERGAIRPAHRLAEQAGHEADPLGVRVGPPGGQDSGPVPPASWSPAAWTAPQSEAVHAIRVADRRSRTGVEEERSSLTYPYQPELNDEPWEFGLSLTGISSSEPIGEGTEPRRHHCVGDLRPESVHHRGAWIVDLPVQVTVQPACAAGQPRVQDPDHLQVAGIDDRRMSLPCEQSPRPSARRARPADPASPPGSSRRRRSRRSAS